MTLDSNLPPPVFASAPRRGNWIWLLELVPLGFGILMGRQIAYEQSVPGNEFGGLGPILLTFFVSVLLAVVGLALLFSRKGRAAAMTFVAMAAVVAGMLGTFKGAELLRAAGTDPGITYVPPVVIRSIGTSEVTLSGVSNFSGVSDNGASCTSLDDSTVVGQVQTLSAGEFGGGTLRATLTLDALGKGQISLWIDAGDLAEGQQQPFWDGAVTISGATTDNKAGNAAFTSATDTGAGAGKGPANTDGSWPAILSGSLEWTCRS